MQETQKVIEREAASALSAAPSEPAAGAAAVADSQARETMRSANAAASGAESGLRSALDKSFAYQAGYWVDTAYKTDFPKRELAFGSDDYFKLLAQHPEWAPYLAVSSNVIVVLDRMAYVVTDSGQPLVEPQPAGSACANGTAGEGSARDHPRGAGCHCQSAAGRGATSAGRAADPARATGAFVYRAGLRHRASVGSGCMGLAASPAPPLTLCVASTDEAPRPLAGALHIAFLAVLWLSGGRPWNRRRLDGFDRADDHLRRLLDAELARVDHQVI